MARDFMTVVLLVQQGYPRMYLNIVKKRI